MKSANIKTSLIDHYYTLLKSLSANNKLELISRLSESMKPKKTKSEDSWKSLFGALKLDQSTDGFIEELENSRDFNREFIDL